MYIETVKIERTLEKEQSVGNVEIQVEITGELEEERYLWSRILDKKGEEADSIFPLLIEEHALGFCMRVTDPMLWDAETALCYNILIEIRDQDQNICQTVTKKLAFYAWELQEGRVLLNGREVPFRCRAMKTGLSVQEMDAYFRQLKREFVNTVLLKPEQRNDFLDEKALEYGLYLVSGGEHLEYGRITAELEKNPAGYHSEKNPDFTIQVVKEGALIENRSVFANAAWYQLRFEVCRGEELIQKGKLHADIPAGETRYINIPYMELQDAGKYRYRVSLCLESDAHWEEEGYPVAYGENIISNFYGGVNS